MVNTVSGSLKAALPYRDRLTPGRALSASILIWIVAFTFAPIEPRWSDIIEGYALFVLCIISLFLGMAMPFAMQIKINRVFFSEKICKNAIVICSLLGTLGLIFRLYDLFVLRGLSAELDFISARSLAARTEASFISVLAAATLPFGIAALLVTFYSKAVGFISRINYLYLISALLPVPIPFIFGSRSGLLIFLLMILVAAVNLMKQIRLRDIASVIFAGALVLFLFSIVFLNRLEASGISFLYAARFSAYTQVLPLTPAASSVIENAGELSASLAGFASLLQYLLHGAFEFLYLVELKQENFAFGANSFFFVPKIIDVLFGTGNVNANQLNIIALNPRIGVFQTLMGGLYLDFGYFSPIVCLALGFYTSIIRLHIQSGNVFAFQLYCLFVSQMLLALYVDGFAAYASVLSNLGYYFMFLIGSSFQLRSSQ